MILRTSRFLSAFTLVELLAVIVIVTILCMAVVVAADTRSHRVRTAADLLVADLQFAQVASTTRGADPCMLQFYPDGSGYWVASHSDPHTPIALGAMAAPYEMHWGTGHAAQLGGVEVVEVSTPTGIAFTQAGRLTQDTDITVTLRCGPSTAVVQVLAATGDADVQ